MEKILKKLLSRNNLILAIPAITIALLANWTSFLGRVVFDGNYLAGFNGIFNTPAVLLHVLPMSFQQIDLLIFLGAGAIVAFLIHHRRSSRKNYKTGQEHGSARWGKPEDLEGFTDEKNIFNNVLLSKTEGLSLDNVKDWRKNRNKNILVVGGSGSGKTRYFIKPNILQGHSSYVVTDPKGTILNEVGTFLEKAGYEIRVLDLIDLTKSQKYNPMAYISGTQDILKLVETLFANTSGEGAGAKEDFWVKAERLLFQALIAGVFFDFAEREKNLGSVTELLSMMEVREDDPDFKNSVDLWFEDMEEKATKMLADPKLTPAGKTNANGLSYAVMQYKNYKLAAGKTAKSILISCAARMSAVNIPEVKELLSEDDLGIDTLGNKKTALFVIIPDTDKTYNFIASIMYTQLFNILCTTADKKYGGKLPIHVRCLLDEFANIGKIPNWEILITTIRSRGISAAMVVQTKSQLKAMYKDHAETIIGNCDSEVFLGGKEKGTLKEIAETLGKETIHDVNTSASKGQSESHSTNYSKLGSDLMSMGELAVMNRGKCVVQISGIHPFFSDKYELTTHPNYIYHADSPKDKNWFDFEKYIKRKNNQPISMQALVKRVPKARKIKENIHPIEVNLEDEAM